ncbi:MAG: GNAT family N-acetyltransferase [Actinomycetes bacterium]
MIEISRATVADVDVLHGLVESYRAFYKQEPNSKTLGYLTDRLSDDEAIVFLACDVTDSNSRAVGFTMIYPTFSTVSLSQIWLLNDLYVDETSRRQGVSQKLMDRAESEAKASGATRLFLRTANDNVTAQALYEGRGWVRDEIFRRYDLVF